MIELPPCVVCGMSTCPDYRACIAALSERVSRIRILEPVRAVRDLHDDDLSTFVVAPDLWRSRHTPKDTQ